MTTLAPAKPTVQAAPFSEPLGILKAPGVAQAADLQSAKFPESAENDASAGGTAWTSPTSAKASDNSYATITTEATTEARESQYLLVKKLKFAIPEAATILGIITSVERKASGSTSDFHVTDLAARIVKGGVIGSMDKAGMGYWPTADAVRAYGSASDLWGETWTPGDINAEGFGFALRCTASKLKGGGSAVTASVDAISITVYYTEAADPNIICAAGRSAEFRSDGVYCQDPEDDVWGALVPADGSFLPYSAPSGLEGRKSRFILIPSQGDLGELPDSGDNSLSGQEFDQPGYLYSREASE